MIRDVHCSSRIRILIFLPIPDPGSRGQKGTGPQIPDLDPQHCLQDPGSTILPKTLSAYQVHHLLVLYLNQTSALYVKM
jgi:hypothetical protein